MLRTVVVSVVSVLSVWCRADDSLSQWSEPRPYSEPRLQGLAAVGWRFDHAELGHVPVIDLGGAVKVAKPLFLQTRISLQPEQNSYFVTHLSIGSIALGPRVQSVSRRFGAFGAVELDYSWYFGSTALYSVDSNKVISRVTARSYQTGLALSGGFCLRVTRWLGVDFGVRKVFNSTKNYAIVESPLPPGGLYYWPFPHEIYNQSTIFLQARLL